MLYKLINEGQVPAVRLGKRVLIPRDSILELLGKLTPYQDATFVDMPGRW